MNPAQPPLPTDCSLPFHPEMGSQTSILMSESLEGLNVAATRQNAGSLLYGKTPAAADPLGPGGVNSPAATLCAEGDRRVRLRKRGQALAGSRDCRRPAERQYRQQKREKDDATGPVPGKHATTSCQIDSKDHDPQHKSDSAWAIGSSFRSGWHPALQFLKPVQHDVDLCPCRLRLLAGLEHQKSLAIGSHVVGGERYRGWCVLSLKEHPGLPAANPG